MKNVSFSQYLIAVGVTILLAGCPLPGRSPKAGETRTFDGIEFQWCPPGTFVMGTPSGEAGRQDDESPHAVTISRGFWLSKYEITQAQWESVMDTNPSEFAGLNRPVENVSWHDAHQFLLYLNYSKSGAVYRLPTESEWEYACRAGTASRYYWGEDSGNSEIDDYAWTSGNSNLQSQPVGQKLPNAWGLYDMSGNVWEWCQDWYDPEFYDPDSLDPDIDPLGPESGTNRVIRGGDWAEIPNQCRSGNRNFDDPETVGNTLGFRILRTAH